MAKLDVKQLENHPSEVKLYVRDSQDNRTLATIYVNAIDIDRVSVLVQRIEDDPTIVFTVV